MRRLLLFGVSSLLSRYVRVESDIDLDTGFLVVVPHYGLIFIYWEIYFSYFFSI